MRRLQDIKGEEALDVLAEIIDPVITIIQDAEIVSAIRELGANNINTIKLIIKGRKKEILTIMAAIDGKPYEEFIESFNLVTLPLMLVETFNDPEVQVLFQSQTQTDSETEFGSATESTEGEEN